MVMGTSLSVQPLRLHASSAGHAGSISGRGELRSYMLRGTAKKKIKIKIIETEPESFLIERESREVK